MTTAQHDPERDAAGLLGGDLPPAARAAFEAHMLSCDACWSEVSRARTGRALAEGLRESAPQDLRELLRAIASTSPESAGAEAAGARRPARPSRLPSNRRTAKVLAAAATLAVLAAGAVLLVPGSENREASLIAAASVFQNEPRNAVPVQAQPPVRNIAGMAFQGSVAQPLAGQPALVYRYADTAGHRVVLVSSSVEFPRAANAVPIDAMGKNWIATVDGTQMLCVDHDGLSWLVMSDSRDEALAAGREAGLV